MSSTRLSIAALLLSSAIPAQLEGDPAEAPPPQPTSTLLVRLKDRSLSYERAEELVSELMTRKVRARLQANRILRDQYLRLQKAFHKDAERTMARLEMLAQKAQAKQLGRTGQAEVERLRRESMAVSRSRGLTKKKIRSEVDPRIEQLRELLRPELEDILAADEKIGPALEALRLEHAELQDWYVLYARPTEGLELLDLADQHFKKYPMPSGPGDAERIDEAVQLATFAGLAMATKDKKALEANEAIRSSTPHQEYLGVLDLNEKRYLLGLPMLRIDEKLSDASRDHSKDMHTMGFFSHTSPIKGKEGFGQRAANFGTSASAENIAAGQQTGHGAIRAWWYSPGHHRNMLGNHRRVGLGQHATMWTQMLGG